LYLSNYTYFTHNKYVCLRPAHHISHAWLQQFINYTFPSKS